MLQQLIQSIQTSKTIAEAMYPVLHFVTQVINSSGCCIFVFEKEIFSENDKQKLIIQKTVVESKYIDVACSLDTKVQMACFDKLQEAQNPIYTKNFISYPIFDTKGNLMATIQLESKYKLLN